MNISQPIINYHYAVIRLQIEMITTLYWAAMKLEADVCIRDAIEQLKVMEKKVINYNQFLTETERETLIYAINELLPKKDAETKIEK